MLAAVYFANRFYHWPSAEIILRFFFFDFCFLSAVLIGVIMYRYATYLEHRFNATSMINGIDGLFVQLYFIWMAFRVCVCVRL